MSIWALVGILIFVLVIFGALYVSKLAVKREMEEQNKKRQVRNLRVDLSELEEIISTLLVFDRNPELLNSLLNEMEERIQQGFSIMSESKELDDEQNSLAKLRQSVDELENNAQPEVPTSDRQIHLMKSHFSRAIRKIREMQASSIVNEADASEHRQRLIKNTLLLEVKAYKRNGDEAKKQNELSTAANYYKYAKELLIGNELKFHEKTEMIKTISKSISSLYVSDHDHELDGQ